MSPARNWPPWAEDPDDQAVADVNVGRLVEELAAQGAHRAQVSLDLLRGWHTQVHAGCAHVPVAEYVGHFRGEPYLHLRDFPSGIVASDGTVEYQAPAPDQVAELMAKFLDVLNPQLERLDGEVETLSLVDLAERSAELAAWAHCWVVYVHPFVDGNGRVARLVANWVMTRYGFPVILPGRPRPEHARLRMVNRAFWSGGDLNPAKAWFLELLGQALHAG